MITGLAARVLLITLSFFQVAAVPDTVAVTVVNLGDNVTFNCYTPEQDLKFFHWYKQPLGRMVEPVMSMILGRETTNDKFKGSRFTSTSEESWHFLTISNVSKEDEATYLCHTGTTFSQNFNNATFLVVNDPKQQKSVHTEQSWKTELVQQRDLINLQCSGVHSETEVLCPAGHSAYWFRTKSEGFHPAILYIQRNISDEDVERGCSYSLSVRDSYDDGAHLCAVVTCGADLFAEGRNLKTRPGSDFLVIMLGGLLVCSLIVIILLIFYIKQNKICKGEMSICQLGDDKSCVDQSNNLDTEVMEASYATVQTRTKEERRKRESIPECDYSFVSLDRQLQSQ